MRLSEAIELLESEGLLLERIKKYRTTSDERRFRDTRSSTDESSIREKLLGIAEENGLEPYCDSISVESHTDEIDCEISFIRLSSDEREILEKIARSLSIHRVGSSSLYFAIPVVKKQSQWKIYPSVMIGRALKDAFNVPPKVAYDELMKTNSELDDNLYQAYKDDDIVEADSYIKEMYDLLEEWIEKEQYGGIQNLTYQKFRDTVYDALDKYESEKNQDKFVTNKYGQERKINKMYLDFSKFCRIFSREINRQRGPYRPQA